MDLLKDSELQDIFKKWQNDKDMQEAQHDYMSNQAKLLGWTVYLENIPKTSPLEPQSPFQLPVLVASMPERLMKKNVERTIETGIHIINHGKKRRSASFKSCHKHTELLPDLFDTHDDGVAWELVDVCANMGLSPAECLMQPYVETDDGMVHHLVHRSIFQLYAAYRGLIWLTAAGRIPRPNVSGYRTTNGVDSLEDVRKGKPSTSGFHTPFIDVTSDGTMIFDVTHCETKVPYFCNPVASVAIK